MKVKTKDRNKHIKWLLGQYAGAEKMTDEQIAKLRERTASRIEQIEILCQSGTCAPEEWVKLVASCNHLEAAMEAKIESLTAPGSLLAQLAALKKLTPAKSKSKSKR